MYVCLSVNLDETIHHYFGKFENKLWLKINNEVLGLGKAYMLADLGLHLLHGLIQLMSSRGNIDVN
jgi:hypothetical protein